MTWTTQAPALTMNCLLDHTEQMRLLSNDLSLAANAFEESLRFNGPLVNLQRKTLRDVEIAGVKVPRAAWSPRSSAPPTTTNRSSRTRASSTSAARSREFLSMSSGNHQCIGQPLARLEARVAFEEWFSRVSSFVQGPATVRPGPGPPGVRSVAGDPGTQAGKGRQGTARQRRQGDGDGGEARRHVRQGTGPGQAPDHDGELPLGSGM